MKNKVSILITNFNKADYIEECITSCIKQSYDNFEILLADNYSTDNSSNIIKKFNKNIKLFNIKKIFANAAANQLYSNEILINNSSGDFLCLLDSDDFFELNKLKYIVDFFNNNQNLKLIIDSPLIIKNNIKYKFKPKIKKNNFIWPSIFPTSTLSIRNNFFDNKKIKNLIFDYSRKYNFLEIDFRIQSINYFILNSYKIRNDFLTNYRIVNHGIMSKQKKFTKVWWIKRMQAHNYCMMLHNEYSKFYKKNLDFKITKFINYFLK